MNPTRNKKEFYKNDSSEKFRENMDWFSNDSTEGADVLNVFVPNASACSVKTCFQISTYTSVTEGREGQLIAGK